MRFHHLGQHADTDGTIILQLAGDTGGFGDDLPIWVEPRAFELGLFPEPAFLGRIAASFGENDLPAITLHTPQTSPTVEALEGHAFVHDGDGPPTVTSFVLPLGQLSQVFSTRMLLSRWDRRTAPFVARKIGDETHLIFAAV